MSITRGCPGFCLFTYVYFSIVYDPNLLGISANIIVSFPVGVVGAAAVSGSSAGGLSTAASCAFALVAARSTASVGVVGAAAVSGSSARGLSTAASCAFALVTARSTGAGAYCTGRPPYGSSFCAPPRNFLDLFRIFFLLYVLI